MKPKDEDRVVEQSLERLRLTEPGPGFKARVLGAARREWQEGAGEEGGWLRPLFRPAFALAASLVIAALGGWANDALVRAPRVEPSKAAAETEKPEMAVAAESGQRFRFVLKIRHASRASTVAALGERRDRLDDLLGSRSETPFVTGPDRGTQGLRQKPARDASYC